MRLSVLFVAACLVVSAPSIALAASPADPDAAPQKDKAEDRSVFVTVSPLRALARTVEVGAEVRVASRFSVDVHGAYTSLRIDQVGATGSAWTGGAQAIAYPVGHFDHGMQLGAQLEVAYASLEMHDSDAYRTASGTGIAPGAFVGYKYATSFGLTLAAQGGVQYMTMNASALASNGMSAEGSQSKVAPLANLLVGWSF